MPETTLAVTASGQSKTTANNQAGAEDLAHGGSQGRLMRYGPNYLTNTELVAILLWSGMEKEDVYSLSSRLLSRLGGLPGLGRSSLAEICDEMSGADGTREIKACQLLAALELGRRFSAPDPPEGMTINSPQDVASLVAAEMSSLDQEHLRVVLLNTQNQVMSVREIYVGNVNATVVRPVEVFRPAIRQNAPAVIVVHNHPSGDPTPSAEDVMITRDLLAAGRLLGIELLDHVVIGSGRRYASLNEEGLGFA
jgi:DNA repair protein RadC